MKKFIKLSFLFLSLIFFVSCVQIPKSQVVGVTKIQCSNEARIERNKISPKTKESLKKENFDNTLLDLYARSYHSVISFPEVPVKNKLENKYYGSNRIYTLSEGKNWDCVFIYLHGGMFINNITEKEVEFCDELTSQFHAKVYMPLYPLAPDYDFTAAFKLLDDVYNEICELNKPVYVIGDCSGGNIALAYTEYLKSLNKSGPDKLILINPILDITNSNKQIKYIEADDPIFSVYGSTRLMMTWNGEYKTYDYRVSPIFGDLSSAPIDTLLIAPKDDIFYQDIANLYDLLVLYGKDVKMIECEGLWHDFIFYDIPEAKQVKKMIIDYCK